MKHHEHHHVSHSVFSLGFYFEELFNERFTCVWIAAVERAGNIRMIIDIQTIKKH